MHLVTYFNKSNEENSAEFGSNCRVLYIVELWLIVMNVIYISFCLNINITVNQFKRNWTNILSFHMIQSLIHSLIWFIQQLIFLFSSPKELKLFNINCYLGLSMIRSICLFISFFILCSFLAEKGISTFFRETYEITTKPFISYVIIGATVIIGVVFGTTFHLVEYTYYHLSVVLFVNIFAVVAFIVLKNINQKYNRRIKTRQGTYSLEQRYEISDNIKCLKMVETSAFLMVFFNILLVICLATDNFSLPIFQKKISYAIFKCLLLLSSFTTLYSLSRNSPIWKFEASRRFRVLLFSISTAKVAVDKKPRIVNVFGKEMATTYDVSTHFHNLQKVWDETSA